MVPRGKYSEGTGRCYAAGSENKAKAQAKERGRLWKLEKAGKQVLPGSLQEECSPADAGFPLWAGLGR